MDYRYSTLVPHLWGKRLDFLVASADKSFAGLDMHNKSLYALRRNRETIIKRLIRPTRGYGDHAVFNDELEVIKHWASCVAVITSRFLYSAF